MIVEYDKAYDEDIKILLEELQAYIAEIAQEKYNILTSEYKEKYFLDVMQEIKLHKGKMFLYKEKEKIIGLVVGSLNNEEENSYDFKAPKRGRIKELVVTKKVRSKGIGTILLKQAEDYLKSEGCKDILIEVFGYNQNALKFYNQKGYHTRMIEVTKKVSK